MKLIPLTQGQFAKVDDDLYEMLNQDQWYAKFDKKVGSYYAQRNICVDGRRSTITMHAFIMDTPDGMHCDHEDHDTLNNQRANLRNCTPAQNQMNRNRANSNNRLGAKGIRLLRGKYHARLCVGRQRVHIGVYSTLEEAVKARRDAEQQYFGGFAATVE